MGTIEYESAPSESKSRTGRLVAALVGVTLALAGAFVVGYRIAPEATVPARVTPIAVPAGEPHSLADAARESRALRQRAATLRPGTKVVTAGGWTGVVDAETGVPVSAGIP